MHKESPRNKSVVHVSARVQSGVSASPCGDGSVAWLDSDTQETFLLGEALAQIGKGAVSR